jgi:hypothetical protein
MMARRPIVSVKKIEMREVWEHVEQKGAIKSRRF